ncbi:MAG TPA: cupin domain-containing protein [Xanthobacteraceae bacterium]|jgi:uncharacterized protein YjlB
MSLIESVKKTMEQVTGRGRPSERDLDRLVRPRKAHACRFKDDGLVPNHPKWPLILYRSPVRLVDSFDPAAIFEQLFERNGWGDSWRDGIYDYVHYHPRTHEVLGIARGHARVQFGGAKGREIEVKAGDVVILPAGTGHRRLSASKDLLVVGAYPPSGQYEEFRASRDEHDRALAAIARVPPPKADPVYGRDGPLIRRWR